MSKLRRLLKAGGIKRRTYKVVLALTVTDIPVKAEYAVPTRPGWKGVEQVLKPEQVKKQEIHLNIDAGNLTATEVKMLLVKAMAEVEERLAVEQAAKEHAAVAMMEETVVPYVPLTPEQMATNYHRGREQAFLDGMMKK